MIVSFTLITKLPHTHNKIPGLPHVSKILWHGVPHSSGYLVMEGGGGWVKEGPAARNMMEGISLARDKWMDCGSQFFGLDGFIPSRDVPWKDSVV